MKSVEELKKWTTPSDEQLAAAETLFMAMAIVETIKPTVKGYQRKILDNHKFRFLEKHDEEYFKKKTDKDYCSDSEQTHLISDKDFKVYLDECEVERKKSNLSVLPHNDGEGYCPLLMAESDQNEAEHYFIESFEPLTGINCSDLYKLEYYNKMKELLLTIIAPHINKEEIMKKISRR